MRPACQVAGPKRNKTNSKTNPNEKKTTNDNASRHPAGPATGD